MKKSLLFYGIGVLLASLSLATFAFTNEQQDAFYRSREMGLTTAISIENADMYGTITRAEMAEILSNFAKNLLGKPQDGSKNCSYSDISILSKKQQDSIIDACKLGIISNGNQKFRPNDVVSRAEFATALSRTLWGNTYDEGNPYYVKHLNALKDAGIISNNLPHANKILETKAQVIVMLKKSYEIANGKVGKENSKNRTKSQVKAGTKSEITSTMLIASSTGAKVTASTGVTQSNQQTTTKKNTNQNIITHTENNESEFNYNSGFVNQLIYNAKKQGETNLVELLEIELSYLNNAFEMTIDFTGEEFARSLGIELDNFNYANMTQNEREQLIKKFRGKMNEVINENKEINNNFIKNLGKAIKTIDGNDKFGLKEKYVKYEDSIISSNRFLDDYVEILGDLMETAIMYGDNEELKNNDEMLTKTFLLLGISLEYHSSANTFQKYLNEWGLNTMKLLGGKLVKE